VTDEKGFYNIGPWWAMPCVYQESQALPYFFIEDVFIGGFVAERCQVKN
jgi:hypothetical protein